MFLLWKLDDRRVDAALTVLIALLLLGSRFALLASGPWEWDETIFARGMLHFQLAGHFPQPPGFPGLLALGHLLLPLAGTPYRALQILSALCSVLALWPLAALGRKVAPAPVALLSAVVILLLPGPWLFSVRGFSTIPATFFLVTAAALWTYGLKGRRVTIFTLLLTIAFLVRPIFLPTVGLLWLCGISQVKPMRRLVPGVLAGMSMIATAIAVMTHLEGGWAAFLAPFLKHASYHAYRLDWNTRELSNFGLIKGVGGFVFASLLVVVSLAGLVVWSRRVGRRVAAAWILLLVLTSAQLIMLQNRSYARYAVVVQMGVAPLIAGAAALAPMPVAIVALVTAAGFAVQRSLPLLHEQHDEFFGAWKATVDAAALAREQGWAVVIEPEMYPFASYLWHVIENRGEIAPPMVLSPRAPEAWQGLDQPWVLATVHPNLYMESLVDRSTFFGEVSDALKPLTQNRFLDAVLSENPPLPVGQWWSKNHLPDGSSFMWAGPQAELWLPPLPAGTSIGVKLRPARGDAPVVVSIHDQSQSLAGHAEASWLWFETVPGSESAPVVIDLFRERGYAPGNGDDRLLSLQLGGVVVRPPGGVFFGPVVQDQDRKKMRLRVDGRYPAEVFAGGREGFWLNAQARLYFVVDEPGRLVLKVSAPRPTPTRTQVMTSSRVVLGPVDVGSELSELSIDINTVDVQGGEVELIITNDAFIPSLDGKSSDSRQLGIVLHALEFIPEAQAPQGWWSR